MPSHGETSTRSSINELLTFTTLKTNKLGWAYADRPNPAEVLRDARIEAEVAQEIADQQKLDAQARRQAYRWKQRQMRQRGRRY